MTVLRPNSAALSTAHARLTDQFTRPPTRAEIALSLGWDVSRVDRALRALRKTGAEVPVSGAPHSLQRTGDILPPAHRRPHFSPAIANSVEALLDGGSGDEVRAAVGYLRRLVAWSRAPRERRIRARQRRAAA